MPTPGKVARLKWPMGPGIRVDSGIEEGQTVGTCFDSMLAKLIVFAPNRDHAVKRMRGALMETAILGLGTNQSYLLALSNHPRVIEGKVDTGFLGREFAAFAPELSERDAGILAAARAQGLTRASAAAAGVGTATRLPSPWEVLR